MKRSLWTVLLLTLVVGCSWFQKAPERLDVYYTKSDGSTLGKWNVSLRPPQPGETAAEHQKNTVLYAAVQAVAGPPSDVEAVRFPNGTHVLDVHVTGSTATIDLSNEVSQSSGGTLTETGEFKGLVYTVTSVPGIDAVQVLVAGRKLESLPGGHLELDQPLHRSDW